MNKVKEFSIDIITKARSRKDTLVFPVVKILNFLKLTPAVLSHLSFFAGLSAAIILPFSSGLFLVLIILHFLSDFFDGSLARYQKVQSKKGEWFDSTIDRAITAFIIIVSVFILKENYWAIILLYSYCFSILLYTWLDKEYQIIYLELVYYLIVYFNINMATLFLLLVVAINLLILVFGIVASRVDSRKTNIN